LGAGPFIFVPCDRKNHGDFEKTNDFGEFLEGDIPPKKTRKVTTVYSHVLLSMNTSDTMVAALSSPKVQVLQSAQEGLSVKAVLELQRMEQAASMDTLDLSRGRSNGYQPTRNLQVSKIQCVDWVGGKLISRP